jgi:hypothetical protein
MKHSILGLIGGLLCGLAVVLTASGCNEARLGQICATAERVMSVGSAVVDTLDIVAGLAPEEWRVPYLAASSAFRSARSVLLAGCTWARDPERGALPEIEMAKLKAAALELAGEVTKLVALWQAAPATPRDFNAAPLPSAGAILADCQALEAAVKAAQ